VSRLISVDIESEKIIAEITISSLSYSSNPKKFLQKKIESFGIKVIAEEEDGI